MNKRYIFILFLTILFSGTVLLHLRHNETRFIRKHICLQENTHVHLQARTLETFFLSHLSDIEIISELNELKKIAAGGNDYAGLEQDFLSFSRNRGHYDKIRFLDQNGRELVRVDLRHGQPAAVPHHQLQNKSQPYYFQDIRRLPPGCIYISPLDLNFKKQQIEKPFKPVLRIGMPIYNSQTSELRGVLIINYLAAAMLKTFRHPDFPTVGTPSLLNAKGYWLSAENPEDEWGFLFPNRNGKGFFARFPETWQQISHNREGQFTNEHGLFTYTTFDPLEIFRRATRLHGQPNNLQLSSVSGGKSYPWKIVSRVDTQQLNTIIARNLKNKMPFWLGVISFFLVVYGVMLGFIFRTKKQELEQQKRISQLNSELEQRIAERTAELNNSNRWLSNILNTTQQGFIATDRQAVVTKVNPAILKILGRSQDKIIGKKLYELTGEKNRDFLINRLILTHKEPNDEFDLDIQRPDGSICHCHFAVTYLFNEKNEIDGGFALVSNIDERIKVEQALAKAKEEAEKNSAAKSLFLSSVSHEFRTPMNSILGFAQLLALEKGLTDKQKDYIDKILVSGEHLGKLINDILDQAKIEAGIVELDITEIDFCQTISTILGLVAPQAQSRGIHLQYDREKPESCLVMADQVRLQQIIFNLLDNAIKYNHAGGKVEIYCERLDASWLRLNVVDDGPGIPDTKLKSLFEPFNRLGVETSAIQGVGLGLTISRSLATMMSCRLGLLKKDGPGCHFYLDVPLSSTQTEAIVSHSPSPSAGETEFDPPQKQSRGKTSTRLLYIEDNEFNRLLLASIVEKRPEITLIVATNGRQGIVRAQEEQPDLILVDIELPDIDGFSVCRELHSHDTTRKIPVVALSGNASPEDVEKARAAGFAGHIAKPINISNFFAILDGILAKK